ncbi:hypothetical protein [Paenibacillus lautus]|uniref:hypothetical protein n=1 Tax=Paenibacillus lautus TaxID=1401 RepID=UPI003D2D7041
MISWFVAEYLMRQQQMEVDRTARESWKYGHDPVKLVGTHLPEEETTIATSHEKDVKLN